MNILALHLWHDTAIALYDDFERRFIAKEERFNRVKCYNSRGELPKHSFARLRENFDLSRVDAVVMTRTFLPAEKKFSRNRAKECLGSSPLLL